MAIQTVLFDLGGVLVHWDPRLLYRKLIPEEAEMERFLSEVCHMDWNNQMDRGVPFADAVAELSAVHPAQADLIRAYHHRWEEMLGGPVEGTVEVLRELRGRYPLFALTNWSAETFPIARRRFEFLQWFDGILVSGEEKLMKPDPAIFHLVRERFSLDPGATLFIDDSAKNIATASEIGFHTHHFNGPEGLRRQLQASGIL